MKTKYIKVAVSDRLPKKGGTKDSDIGLVFYNEKLKLFEDNDMPAVVYPEYFFEEFPDHEAELVEALKKISEYSKEPTSENSKDRFKRLKYIADKALIQKVKSDE